MDKRVLLIDLNFREPKVHKRLNISNGVGLSEYLRDSDMKLDNIVINVIDNLDIITVGTVSQNSSELLMGDRFNQLIRNLENSYDYIILNSTPITSP